MRQGVLLSCIAFTIVFCNYLPPCLFVNNILLIVNFSKCRCQALVSFMRSSTKASAQLRRLQLDAIRQESGGEGLNSDSEAISAEEVTEDERPDGEPLPQMRRVLQLVRPVDTRWNSTFFMVQRYSLVCVEHLLVHFFAVLYFLWVVVWIVVHVLTLFVVGLYQAHPPPQAHRCVVSGTCRIWAAVGDQSLGLFGEAAADLQHLEDLQQTVGGG